MTFAEGTRYLLAEPVEGWKADDIAELEPSLAAMPPDTVLVLIARGKAPAKLAKAVEKAGGEVREYGAPKPWELPKWVVDRAREEGLAMDTEAAKQLIQTVGSRQQQLQREVEKLRIALHPAGHATAADVDELAAGEATAQVYDLADSIVAADLPAALALAEQLRAADERPGKLTYRLVSRLRDVHRAAVLLDAGVPEQKVGGRAEDAAVGGQADASPRRARPTARCSSARSRRWPSSSSSRAAAATGTSTRTPPSR